MNRTIQTLGGGGLFMKKINLLVLQVLYGLLIGLTLVTFVVLGFYLRIVAWVFRSDLSLLGSAKPSNWVTIGSSRILMTTLLPLTASLVKALNYMTHQMHMAILKRSTGEKS